MGWTTEQQNRLNKEWSILKQYFPSFQFVNIGSGLCLEGWMKTNKGNNYKLRLYVPKDIPNSVPSVVIISPSNLTDYHGKLLKKLGYSSTMHLLTPKDDYPKICTYKDTHWYPNRTFYNVLMKVRIWLEALDGHKETGKPLNHYLKHQS